MSDNTMTPSPRSIDAMVAENIMGYKWYHSKYVGRSHCPQEVWSYQLLKNPPTGDWEGSVVDISEVPDKYRFNYASEYSTDIAAAKDVIKKLQGEGWSITINDGHGFDHNLWCVEFHIRDNFQGISVDTEHESLETAICLAALKAKGITI